ncbi:NAD(P)/FAD-dependent oxidoreductase [Streptomyces prunicolor]|uniref:NAD(P)/FAD-dependent oxidoreductase n=1 Tax=Streptomyces prunicolor TaxID=67348 RepID=UPI0004757A8A|nr:FAD-dependent oxidoreductase [Streptomyces prunicolor]
MSILIVGASAAGMRTAQALRREGYDGGITVVGEEPHHPYDKPPLSKEMLAPDGDAAPVPLLSGDELTALDVSLRLGTRAVALDPSRRVVVTDAGDEVAFTELVIATGVKPVTLPGAEPLAGVYTIRTADDGLALRAELAHASQVVVIGAGFIGAEFASAARAHGVEVSVVEAQDVPMAHVLGPEVGGMLARLHELHGVAVHSGVRFSRFEGAGGRVTGVALSDGRVLPADLVVVGIGARPATQWLESSGLPIQDGVECDANLRVVGRTGIYAAGDVARWQHALYGKGVRIEHWTNANEHAAIVAASILGKPAPPAQVPYVWSDQYGRRIQITGRPAMGEVKAVRGGIDQDSLAAVYVDREGTVVGAVVVDDPRTLMKCRKAVAKRIDIREIDIGLAVTY